MFIVSEKLLLCLFFTIFVICSCAVHSELIIGDTIEVCILEEGALDHVSYENQIIKIIFDEPDVSHLACPPKTILIIKIMRKVDNMYHDYEGKLIGME